MWGQSPESLREFTSAQEFYTKLICHLSIPAEGLMCAQPVEDHGFLHTRPPTLARCCSISAVSCKPRKEERWGWLWTRTGLDRVIHQHSPPGRRGLGGPRCRLCVQRCSPISLCKVSAETVNSGWDGGRGMSTAECALISLLFTGRSQQK